MYGFDRNPRKNQLDKCILNFKDCKVPPLNNYQGRYLAADLSKVLLLNIKLLFSFFKKKITAFIIYFYWLFVKAINFLKYMF